jgi:hypothetical protein
MAASDISSIGLETRIARGRDLLESGLDGELFALDIEGGTCFGFNATAAEIWQRIETPTTLRALCAALIAAHEVDAETCRTQTVSLLEELAREGLVTLDPA